MKDSFEDLETIDEKKKKNPFIYNSEEDVYRINSMLRSRLPGSNKNLETNLDQSINKTITDFKSNEKK